MIIIYLLKEEEETEGDLELSRPYEPVIACLSPSLARLASSRSVWTKTATPPPTTTVDAFTKKRKAEDANSTAVQKTRPSDVERLRNRDKD